MDATIIGGETVMLLLFASAGLALTATGFAVGEFQEWRARRKLQIVITDDQQPSHPPTQPVPIQITSVSDKRRRTAHVAPFL